jgi:hypothetical protein
MKKENSSAREMPTYSLDSKQKRKVPDLKKHTEVTVAKVRGACTDGKAHR